MGYRRLFIMRKDLHMSAGKLAAQVTHCAEAYWTQKFKYNLCLIPWGDNEEIYVGDGILISKEIVEEYLQGEFTKTICEARNKAHLLKAKTIAEELGLKEGTDFDLIYDTCHTELIPEEENGTTLTGIWFKPLSDELAHKISKKYQLYKG